MNRLASKPIQHREPNLTAVDAVDLAADNQYIVFTRCDAEVLLEIDLRADAAATASVVPMLYDPDAKNPLDTGSGDGAWFQDDAQKQDFTVKGRFARVIQSRGLPMYFKITALTGTNPKVTMRTALLKTKAMP